MSLNCWNVFELHLVVCIISSTIELSRTLPYSSSLTICVFCNGESFLDPFEELTKAIGGSIKAWSFMNAWHIVVFKFNNTLTMLLIVLWTFLSFELKYYSCSLKMWLWNLEWCSLISSWVTLILSITSTRTLLILLVDSIND